MGWAKGAVAHGHVGLGEVEAAKFAGRGNGHAVIEDDYSRGCAPIVRHYDAIGGTNVARKSLAGVGRQANVRGHLAGEVGSERVLLPE
ncbi:hypothetical protein F503_06778 [Ophiostoma piceae UAMH 11346]|uniref:Uncharacterized protein n=1 Tax=Ophiostoma piceae (strain UAMH 11346) TaxID=1262450 RepID=S3CPF7_OPHP1|nr:hypothetical protein F503_06778 [Ophiostoma piceae UAMH 11346]